MQAFRLDPRSPNVLAGGKRPADDADADRGAEGRPAVPRHRNAGRRQPGPADPARAAEHHRLRHGRAGGDRSAARQFTASARARSTTIARSRACSKWRTRSRAAVIEELRARAVTSLRVRARLTASRPASSPPGSIRLRAAARRRRSAPRARARGLVVAWTFRSHHTLDNGLDVLVHEDRGCPIVARQRLVPRRIEERSAGPHRLRAPVRAPDVRGLASTTTAAISSRCRKRARRSTARPTPIAPTTGRSCRRTRWSSRCGWSPIAWATCCRR